jgi:hypothetical protein
LLELAGFWFDVRNDAAHPRKEELRRMNGATGRSDIEGKAVR